MSVIPTPFGQSQEAAIASYNYSDIADGTGIFTWYGATSEDSTGKEYILTNAGYTSSGATTFETGGASTVREPKCCDFSTSAFNLPQNMKGTSTIALTSSNTIGINYYKKTADDETTVEYAGLSLSDDGDSTDFNYDVTINEDYVVLSHLRANTTGGNWGRFTVTEGTGTGGNLIGKFLDTAGSYFQWPSITNQEQAKIFMSGDIINIRIQTEPGVGVLDVHNNYTYTGTLFTITNQTVSISASLGMIGFRKLNYELLASNTSNAGSSSKVINTTIPLTHFKKTEKLVVRLDNNYLDDNILTHSPENIDVGGFTAATNHTTLKIDIPFKIDI